MIVSRHRLLPHAGDGGNRNRRAVDGGDLIVHHLVDRQPVALLDLGNHLVRPRPQAEVVGVGAAEQSAQRFADLAHGEAELRGLVAVDFDHLLRRIDFQVAVDEQEQSAGRGVGEEFLRLRIQRGQSAGSISARTGSAGPASPDSAGGRKATMRWPATLLSWPCSARWIVGGVAFPLVPRFQGDAGDRLGRADRPGSSDPPRGPSPGCPAPAGRTAPSVAGSHRARRSAAG